MAFLDLEVGAPKMRAHEASATPAVEKLSPQERRVVHLARTDPASSLRAPGSGRLVRWLFGTAVAHRLADPRLEALRRFAILYRMHGDALAADETALVRSAGISPGAIAHARILIDSARTAQRPPRLIYSLAIIIVMLSMSGFAMLVVTPAVDSAIIAAVLAGAAIATVAPLLARTGPSAPVAR